MEKLSLTYEDPAILQENPWNPNTMDSINEEKLESSIDKLGMKDVIKCRTLDDGTLQIISGKHRARLLQKRGEKVPVLHLGKMTDDAAKKISLVSNEHYGENDIDLMNQLFTEAGWTQDEITSISVLEDHEFDSIFSHNVEPIDFDDLPMDDDDLDDIAELDSDISPVKTHQILRFKVAIEDAPAIQALISRIKREQDLNDSDELTNAGDALVYALSIGGGTDNE